MSLTKQIQNAICKLEIEKGNLVAENFSYFFIGELDVISLNKNGFVSEFEVKVSRSDFLCDRKKSKWQFFNNKIESRIPNYFAYVCPENMIKESDLIYPFMGLIYVTESGINIIRKPKIIHKYKHDIIPLLIKICRINNWRSYFGAAQLTIMNREANEKSISQKMPKL